MKSVHIISMLLFTFVFSQKLEASSNPIMIAPPSNDLIENAINLNFGPASPYNGMNVNFPEATNTNDHTPVVGCGVSQPGVWYKFTATKNGSVAAGIVNPDEAVVVFFEGPANASTGMQLTYIDETDNPCASNPLASIHVTNGKTYYIYMRNLVISNVLVNTIGAFQIPANDLIENATDIAQSSQPLIDNNIHFLVTTDTNDGGQPFCSTSGYAGVWYKITPEVNGTIEALMEGSPASESAMLFYSATHPNVSSGAELNLVDQPTNPCTFNNTSSILAEVGITYYLFAFSASQPYANVIINASQVLGTSENVLEDFKFYPNPVKDELNLSAKTIIEEVNIYNLLGQVVFAAKMNSSNKAINISSLSKGVYVMCVTSEGNTANYRILKE